MKIERIEMRQVRMRLVSPFQTSGWVENDRDCLIISVHSQGITGWGESVAGSGPWYSYETVGTAWEILHNFAIPMITGQDIPTPAAFTEMVGKIRGHSMAKAGLEMALWDWFGQTQTRSLKEMLGGVRDRVDVGVSVGIQPDLPALVKTVGGYLKDGYRRIKIKIKPGWDLEAVQVLRREFSNIPLQVDANSIYTLEQAKATFPKMDDAGLLLIEQPLGYDDIVDHRHLQTILKTPICLDESIHTVDHARQAIELGSCRIINIKLGRVGGVANSKALHDICAQRDVPVWCGGMLETGIGRAANVHLASLPNFRLPGDTSASSRYYHEDLIDPPFVLNPDATLTVPHGPGLGVNVRLDRLHAVTQRIASYTP
ncbi:MAG: o-succinylbenzoate synthase [Chloroflexi bacterium]|nr:o-succinylbenzoate synthase [Chloroflexota bacterium]